MNRTQEVFFEQAQKLVNNTNIPQHQIELITRCILPDILAFYESEEGQREFAEWKKQQEGNGRETEVGESLPFPPHTPPIPI